MCKPARAIIALAFAASACAPAPRIESRIHVAIDGGTPVDVQLSLSAARASQQARWTEAVAAAVRHHVRMLGAAPAALAISDRDVAAPLWSSYRGMAVEAAVSAAIAKAFWSSALPCMGDQAWLVNGLARYTATVALAAQTDGGHEPAATGMLETRYGGGFLPWVVPVTVPAWTAGDAVSRYRAHPGLDPAHASNAPERAASEARVALTMQTLAAWLGGPETEAVLRSFVDRSRGRCASWRELDAAAAAVTGLDLAWLFTPAFGSGAVFDYGVERLESEPLAGRYRTRLLVRRYGDALFTGTSEPPVAPFESGRGVEIAVRFAGGEQRLERWDGRAAARQFELDSGTPAISATVDPRQVMLLDTRRANNSRTTAPRAPAAATRWAARWQGWLQHLLLTYASLV